MKTINLKGLVPKDPAIRILLKRITLIMTIHIALGLLTVKFGATYPLLVFIGLLLCSGILGLIHLFSLESTNTSEASMNQLGLTALLTVLASLSLLIPLLLFAPSLSLMSLAALCFGLAHLINALVISWANQPVFVPEKAEVLDWLQAFLQALVIPNSRYYIIFKMPDKGKKRVIGLPVDYDRLYQQGEITIQTLWSNWVWRYNEKTTNKDIIHTKLTLNQLKESNYLFSFYQRRFFFFKRYLSPQAPFKELKCKWQFTLQRNDLNQWSFIRAFVFHVNSHEPQTINPIQEES